MRKHNREHSNQKGLLPLLPVLAGLLFILFGFLNVLPAHAQNSQYEMIQQYVERNAELLEWAYDVVGDTENMPARRVLEEALGLHRRSIALLDDNHPVMALNTAKHSRTATRNAVRLARESMTFEERVRLRTERFQDQHANLVEKAREANHQRALDFLRRSEELAIRAREQYQQGDARMAFKMLEQAEELMNRAGRMLAGEVGPERLEQKIEMASMAVERAREYLMENANPAARKLLTEAEHALDRAQDFSDQGQPDRGLQQAEMALRLANRALNSATSTPGVETVQRQIERWDDRNSRVAEMVQENGDDSARRFLQRAVDQRSHAAESLAQKEYEPALRKIRAAHDLLTQAEDMVR